MIFSLFIRHRFSQYWFFSASRHYMLIATFLSLFLHGLSWSTFLYHILFPPSASTLLFLRRFISFSFTFIVSSLSPLCQILLFPFIRPHFTVTSYLSTFLLSSLLATNTCRHSWSTLIFFHFLFPFFLWRHFFWPNVFVKFSSLQSMRWQVALPVASLWFLRQHFSCILGNFLVSIPLSPFLYH